VATVFWRQLYFSGLEAVWATLVVAILLGTVIVSQVARLVGPESEYLTGKLMVWVVVRELAPLMTAVIVIGRSGTAIAAELANMKISGETEYLEGLGIPPRHYLIVPRIFGLSCSMVLLTVYSLAGTLLVGGLVASLGWGIPLSHYRQGILSALTFGEIAAALCKGGMFGLVTASIACRQGLGVGKSVTQIPQAATKAVMQSLLAVFLLDGFWALLFGAR
jgi:phospholipid/cholesterol/gamma-HCH transport system permease protein